MLFGGISLMLLVTAALVTKSFGTTFALIVFYVLGFLSRVTG